MNTSIRDNDDIEKNNDHFSNQEEQPLKRKGALRFLKPTLITLLSILCLSGGIALHKFQSIESKQNSKQNFGSYTASSSLSLLKENTAISDDNPLKPLTPLTTLNKLTPKETSLEPINTTNVNQIQESEPLVIDAPLIKEETPIENVEEKTNKPAFLEGLTLKDALKFKENFLAENDCKEDYQKLLNIPNKTNEVLSVLNDLSPYCLNNQKPVQNVLEAFLKNKKEAIIVYYKQNNPAWLAYLKSIPISLIEIRRINPVKNTPKNILYKAQNELLIQNVENAVNYVTQLPLDMQQKMDDFYREAAIYNRSLNSLDQLILSFERKGE